MAKKAKVRVKKKVSKVVHQVKEPLSLLTTLREEGMASAMQFLSLAGSVAGEARRNLSVEMIKPQIKEVVSSLGFAFRSDLERLELRLDDLEEKISQAEYSQVRDEEE